MKVVVDTNVVISGIGWSGAPLLNVDGVVGIKVVQPGKFIETVCGHPCTSIEF